MQKSSLRISISEVVRLIGIERIAGELHRCPRCGHRAMKIKELKNAWYCHFERQGGGPVGLAAFVRKTTKEEADHWLRSELGLGPADEPSALLERIDNALKEKDDEKKVILAAIDAYRDEAARQATIIRAKIGKGSRFDPDGRLFAIREMASDGLIGHTEAIARVQAIVAEAHQVREAMNIADTLTSPCRVLFCYDGDSAGIEATKKAILAIVRSRMGLHEKEGAVLTKLETAFRKKLAKTPQGPSIDDWLRYCELYFSQACRRYAAYVGALAASERLDARLRSKGE